MSVDNILHQILNKKQIITFNAQRLKKPEGYYPNMQLER